MPSIAPESGARPSGRRLRRGEPTPYDFRRPIQLSREDARQLHLAFEGFARQASTVFTSLLRTVCDVHLVRITQQAYGEYVDSLEPLTYLGIFSAEPIAGRGIVQLPMTGVMTAIDHMLGGHGGEQQPQRALTEIEVAVMGELMDRLLAEMRYSLADSVDVIPRATGYEHSPQLAQVAGASDVMVVVRLAMRLAGKDLDGTICLPYAGLHPHLARATAPSATSESERRSRERAAAALRERFASVPVEAAVRLRPTTFTPAEIADFVPGTLVRLRHPSAAPLEVCVDGEVFAHATPGASGPRLAALVVATPEKEKSS